MAGYEKEVFELPAVSGLNRPGFKIRWRVRGGNEAAAVKEGRAVTTALEYPGHTLLCPGSFSLYKFKVVPTVYKGLARLLNNSWVEVVAEVADVALIGEKDKLPVCVNGDDWRGAVAQRSSEEVVKQVRKALGIASPQLRQG